MEKTFAGVYETGRTLLIRLSDGEDLLGEIEAHCLRMKISTATFTVWGCVQGCTLGVYDADQQVFISFRHEGSFQLAGCNGTVSLENGRPAASASCVLVDRNGQTLGGRLFSETTLLGAEAVVTECIGPPIARGYDEPTSLFLWQAFNPEKKPS